MVRSRLDLQALLEEKFDGKVYFQPPENVKIEYPCLVYSKDISDVKYADNEKYLRKNKYSGVIIDRDPENPSLDKILALPYCSATGSYVADGLNHDAFDLYY